MAQHTQREKRTDIPTWSTAEFPNTGYGVDSNGNPFIKDVAGNIWRWIAGVATAAAMTLTGTLTAVAGVFTGRVTTTDGVTGGTARIVGGNVAAIVAAGAALSGTVSETVLASYSIPANMIKQGTILRVYFQVIATATNATDTLTIRLRLGPTTLIGTALLTGAAVDVANGSFAIGYFDLVGRAAPGAAAACIGSGWLANVGTTSAGTAATAQMLASTNFATNGILLLELTGQWSTNNAGNSCRADQFEVDMAA